MEFLSPLQTEYIILSLDVLQLSANSQRHAFLRMVRCNNFESVELQWCRKPWSLRGLFLHSTVVCENVGRKGMSTRWGWLAVVPPPALGSAKRAEPGQGWQRAGLQAAPRNRAPRRPWESGRRPPRGRTACLLLPSPHGPPTRNPTSKLEFRVGPASDLPQSARRCSVRAAPLPPGSHLAAAQAVRTPGSHS